MPTADHAPPTLHRWNDLPADRPMPLLERRRVIGTQAMISHITLEKGFKVAVHAHENEQFSAVLQGHLRFTLPRPDGTPYHIDVRTGEVLHLPANAPHGAEAIETTTVLDIFAPPSEKTGIDARTD